MLFDIGHGLVCGQSDLLVAPFRGQALQFFFAEIVGHVHVFDGGCARGNFVFAQENGEGDSQFGGIVHFSLHLFLLGIQLGTDACAAQFGGQSDGRAQIVAHGQDQHVGGGGVQCRVQISLFTQNVEQAG